MKNYNSEATVLYGEQPIIKFPNNSMSSQHMKLFVNELKVMYWVENTLIKIIPNLIKNVDSKDLRDALIIYLKESEIHLNRLKSVFSMSKVKAEPKECQVMKKLLNDAAIKMESSENGSMIDGIIISTGRKVQHYEIRSYETLCQYAEALGLDDAVELLQTTLYEKMDADEKLGEVAYAVFNIGVNKVNIEEIHDYSKILEDELQYA